MPFYEEGLIEPELHPKWEFWTKVPTANINDLTLLMIGVCPRANIFEVYDDVSTALYTIATQLEKEGDDEKALKNRENRKELINKTKKIKLKIKNAKALIKASIKAGKIKPPVDLLAIKDEIGIPLDKFYGTSIYISDFVCWLESQKIPYPEPLKNCMKMRENPEISTEDEDWKEQKNIMIEPYRVGMYPEEWQPDWEHWAKRPVIYLAQICYLAFDTDIHKIVDLERATKEINTHHLSLHKHVHELEDRAKSFIDAGILKVRNNHMVTTFDFVNWLESESIPYPKKFKECIRKPRIEEKEVEVLTSGQKSGLRQRNNRLIRLFNQMVKLHYRENVTAYEVAKDITADEGTIKQYLDNTKK